MRSCAQPVHTVRVQPTEQVALYAAATSSQNQPVYSYPTYAPSKPTFVLGLVHYFFVSLVSVTVQVVHLIHRTNKDNNKFKVRITHRELCI